MTNLAPGEYEAELNGIRLHYTIRGRGGPLSGPRCSSIPVARDGRPHLEEIAAPPLVIVERFDFITNVAMAEEMVEHIPGAHLEIFEESGHFAMVEEPEKFRQVVKSFLFAP